ncbi:unnamed protein product [Aphis gossypii]|uniref:Uncharacterized protein n=1 Tax=Aphis gossypii TaxID=80765 RepID=A0A9P0IIF0_APHGO|nr:unnamed protein product [Aphis gossypii]
MKKKNKQYLIRCRPKYFEKKKIAEKWLLEHINKQKLRTGRWTTQKTRGDGVVGATRFSQFYRSLVTFAHFHDRSCGRVYSDMRRTSTIMTESEAATRKWTTMELARNVVYVFGVDDDFGDGKRKTYHGASE